MFDGVETRDARPIALMKRLFVVVISTLLLIGAAASYRAYFQVRSLDLDAPRLLTIGSLVDAAVVSSGRNKIDVEVSVVQGNYSEVLFNLHVPGNELAFFDPRGQHAWQSTVLTKERLQRFQFGHARVRAVATGRPQWGRLPPPTIREIDVDIRY